MTGRIPSDNTKSNRYYQQPTQPQMRPLRPARLTDFGRVNTQQRYSTHTTQLPAATPSHWQTRLSTGLSVHCSLVPHACPPKASRPAGSMMIVMGQDAKIDSLDYRFLYLDRSLLRMVVERDGLSARSGRSRNC